ncbi:MULTISPECIES: fimbrial biogenesis chaperone [Serratia]|uniref:fimbrial biogenesis chaperone n=1 Tax=Serratia TaxID=613 RepID=UPI001574DD61|nr:molecular chaperone [Serratia marcescens]MBI6135885.1 molecular chaperone [Serratia marcescens]MDN0029173.1 molecular chaperone [Serratia marcescens]NSM20107.1 fimbria/pilus periplasmic chaperone [Serratia marcescens]NSM49010.1 fimbria/pilus periplasmic chaperone [Serratia marcescens]
MKVVYLALCATLLLNSFQAAAGVVVGGTRLVYPGGKKEATITVKNPDDIPYLVQSWVNADLEGNVKAPFLVTPPLFRLNGGKENTLRVVKTAQALPEDRESVFWLSVKTVPPEAEGKGNHLQIAVRTRIKLFYRPASLVGLPEEAAKKVRWERSGNTLKAINDSPYYLSFSTVSVAGEKIKEPQMVAPFATLAYTLPPSATGKQVSWQVINDYGGLSAQFQQAL